MALSGDEKTLYVCDYWNERVRSVDTSTGHTTPLVGNGLRQSHDGAGTAAAILDPLSCFWDRAANVEPFTYLYIRRTHTCMARVNVHTRQLVHMWQAVPLKLGKIGNFTLLRSGSLVCTADHTQTSLHLLNPNTQQNVLLLGRELPCEALITKGDQPFHPKNCFIDFFAWSDYEHALFLVETSKYIIYRVPVPREYCHLVESSNADPKLEASSDDPHVF
jgi:hypothetical protein